MDLVEPESPTLPPPVRPAPPRYRVWRSPNRLFAGVAGGLATALGVAPVWTRLGFVVLSLFDGLGVAVYLAGFLLLPAGPAGPAPRLFRRIIGLAIVPAWLLIAVADGQWKIPDGSLGLALLLVGVALSLWSPGAPAADAAPPATIVPGAGDPPAARAPEPRAPRSPLGQFTLGAALVIAAVGTLVTEGSAEGIKISFGLAALACGVGLLVGTFAGRARWLVVPAALLAGVSVAGAATEDLDVSLRGTRQSMTFVTSAAEPNPPPANIDKAGGDTRIQLEAVDEPVDGRIRVGYGIVHISAASDVRLEVRARVGLGSIDMPNGSEDGYRRDATYTDGPSDAPLVRYDIAVGFGDISVDRFPPGQPPLTFEPPDPILGAVHADGAGGLVYEDGAHQLADGTIYLPDGTVVSPSGEWILGAQASLLPTGEVLLPDGTRIGRDGTVTLWSGVVIRPVPPGRLGLAPTTVAGTAPPTAPTSVPPATTSPATSVVPTSAPAAAGPTTVAQP
jgi:phage shock protein PspC (stress-responsive transcriptional regulator)